MTMGISEAAQAIEVAHTNLLSALRDAWRLCEQLDEGPIRPGGPRAGTNLPDLLAAALQTLAGELGDTEELVKHRPGCWEADHVRMLGYT